MIYLQEMARQIRGSTLEILEYAEDPWLTWTPPGTSNHILWHAGHALWLQDVLCIRPLTGTSELPEGWSARFGQDSRPAYVSEWPLRGEVQSRLELQLQRILQVLEDRMSGRVESQLASRIIHGLHDEARHQGETYLLLKLCRTR